eukprot:SAG11_NODE_37010_length_258_cov_36.855346_1_plen_26_part_10
MHITTHNLFDAPRDRGSVGRLQMRHS